MKKSLWYLTACAFIVIGVAGVLAFGWKTADALPEFEKKWSFESADLRKLAINSDYAVDITFVKSTDGTNSITLKGAGKEKMIEKIQATEISSQSLQLDLVQTPRKWVTFFHFNSQNVKEQLLISVKDDFVLDRLELELDSGNLKINDAVNAQLEDTQLSVDSGNITLNNFKSTRLDLDIDSGHIKGDQLTADLTASVDSGNIEIKNVIGRSSISIDSGNVRLYKLDNSPTEISADSGNVYVQVPASFAGFYDLEVDSGNISAPEAKRETKDYIKVETDSGNIKIEQK